jgi:hypothetical protein
VLLVGCVAVNVQRVSPGAYPNYREMAIAQMDLMPYYEEVPRDLVHRINICSADLVLGYYATYELERLDKYARGELHLSDDELEDLREIAKDRAGGHEELMEKAQQRCPDVFRDAEAYRKTRS